MKNEERIKQLEAEKRAIEAEIRNLKQGDLYECGNVRFCSNKFGGVNTYALKVSQVIHVQYTASNTSKEVVKWNTVFCNEDKNVVIESISDLVGDLQTLQKTILEEEEELHERSDQP